MFLWFQFGIANTQFFLTILIFYVFSETEGPAILWSQIATSKGNTLIHTTLIYIISYAFRFYEVY